MQAVAAGGLAGYAARWVARAAGGLGGKVDEIGGSGMGFCLSGSAEP